MKVIITHLSRLAWRKIGIAIAGGTVVAAGLVMLITPGPGLVAIAAGLGILAAEYAWAKRLLQRVKQRLHLKNTTPPEK